ncbi:MAG: hypothetical protein R2716_01015 [Microthrixaceae bacterium]
MSATLAPMGRLSTWWRDRLTEFVGAESRGAELWNLLPWSMQQRWGRPPTAPSTRRCS